MCHPPRLSHLFRPLPGAAPDMAGSTFAAMGTASGSLLVRTVPEQHRAPRERRISGSGSHRLRRHEQDTGERRGFCGRPFGLRYGTGPRARFIQARQHSPHHGSDRLHRSAGSLVPRGPITGIGRPEQRARRSHHCAYGLRRERPHCPHPLSEEHRLDLKTTYPRQRVNPTTAPLRTGGHGTTPPPRQRRPEIRRTGELDRHAVEACPAPVTRKRGHAGQPATAWRPRGCTVRENEGRPRYPLPRIGPISPSP